MAKKTLRRESDQPHNYVYPPDPVNDFDLNGMWSVPGWGIAKQYGKDLLIYNPVTGIYGAAYNTYRAVQSPKNYVLDVGRAGVTYLPMGKVLSVASKFRVAIHGPHHSWPNLQGIKGKVWKAHIQIRNVITQSRKQIPFGPKFLYKYGIKGPKGRILW